MMTSLRLIALVGLLSVCIYLSCNALYVAGSLATAETVKGVPVVGGMASERITAWTLGAVERDVIEEASAMAGGVPLTVTGTYTGEAFVDPTCDAPFGPPVGGYLTQGFHAGHNGIDIGVNMGTPVVATHCGVVSRTLEGTTGYGYLVVVANGPWSTYYAHNAQLRVRAGDRVERGSVIALSGSTGRSTGPHVHYEVRLNNVAQDPAAFGGVP